MHAKEYVQRSVRGEPRRIDRILTDEDTCVVLFGSIYVVLEHFQITFVLIAE